MPIKLFSHDSHWMVQAEGLIEDLSSVLGTMADRFDHVGSTAVPGLDAKRKLHIDVTLTEGISPEIARGKLLRLGYADLGYLYRGDELHLTRPEGNRFSARFSKETGTVMAHRVCLCRAECTASEERRRFRDALRQDRELARQYQRLKRQLALDFGETPDWDKYNSGKAAFITGGLAATHANTTKKRLQRSKPVAGDGAN